jgi:hypothetical protein
LNGLCVCCKEPALCFSAAFDIVKFQKGNGFDISYDFGSFFRRIAAYHAFKGVKPIHIANADTAGLLFLPGFDRADERLNFLSLSGLTWNNMLSQKERIILSFSL